MTLQDYLNQAKERYPRGTLYVSPYRKDNAIINEVVGDLKAFGNPKQKTYPGGVWITDGYGGSVYAFNAWAEIIAGNYPQNPTEMENITNNEAELPVNPLEARRWYVSYGPGIFAFPEFLKTAWDDRNGFFYVYFAYQGNKFSIMFDSKSSYMAANYGTEYPVEVMSDDRKNKLPGTAKNMRLSTILEVYGPEIYSAL